MTSTNNTAAPKGGLGEGIRVALGIGGLVSLVLGLLIMFFPAQSGVATLKFVAILAAVYAFIAGIVYLGTAIFGRVLSGWGRIGYAALGVLYVIGGIIMMVNLSATAAVLGALLSITIGVLWIFEGIVTFVAAFKGSDHKVWAVIYGIVSVIAGVTLVVTPLLGAVTLWLLLGAAMVVMGVVQIVRAIRIK